MNRQRRKKDVLISCSARRSKKGRGRFFKTFNSKGELI